jgi:hypothetical protein
VCRAHSCSSHPAICLLFPLVFVKVRRYGRCVCMCVCFRTSSSPDNCFCFLSACIFSRSMHQPSSVINGACRVDWYVCFLWRCCMAAYRIHLSRMQQENTPSWQHVPENVGYTWEMGRTSAYTRITIANNDTLRVHSPSLPPSSQRLAKQA